MTDVHRPAWEMRLFQLEAVVRAVLPTVCAGAALGVGSWWLLHLDQSVYFRTNKIPTPDRMHAAWYPVIAALVAGIGHGGLALWAGSEGSPAGSWLSRMQTIGARLYPWRFFAFSLPLLAFCAAPAVETKRPGLLTIVILLAAACWGHGVTRLAASRASESKRLTKYRWLRWLPLVGVATGCILYALQLSRASIAMHRRLLSHLDLAVYENVLWNTGRGNFLGCSICKGGSHASSHFDPILAFLAPIYRLFPQTSTLLIAQSVWLSLGAIPLYGIALAQLRSRAAAAAVAICYLLAPAMHGANLFGFHSLVLCAPLVLCALYFLDQLIAGRSQFSNRSLRGYWLSIGLLLLVREDMALVSCGIGLYAYFSGRRGVALFTLAIAGVYLVGVKTWGMVDSGLIMSDSSNTVSFAHYFNQLIPYRKEGGKGLLVSLLTNPVYGIYVVLQSAKLRYMTLLVAPLMVLPFFAPRRLWACLWGVAFLFLASRKAVYSPHFQYSMLILPGLFAALPAGIVRLAKRWSTNSRGHSAVVAGMVVACLASSALMAAKFGVLHRNSALHGGWASPVWSFDLRGSAKYRALEKMIQQIPAGASVAATRGLLPYVAARDDISQKFQSAEYLLIDKGNFGDRDRKSWRLARNKWTYKKIAESHGLQLRRRTGSRT